MLRYALLLILALASIPLISPHISPHGGKMEPTGLNAGSAPRTEQVERPPPATVEPLEEQAALALHHWYTEEFINQEGFGMRRMLSAEMQHRSCTIHGGVFGVQRRLIGDWREGGPRLYDVASIGPLMKESLPRIKSLPLDELDAIALAALRGGAQLVIDSDRTRMHGAIRARRACTKCHDIAIGAVLGAMRYDLTRDREINLVPSKYQSPTSHLARQEPASPAD
jgi:hypothetical protein